MYYELTNYGSKMTCIFYDAGPAGISHGIHTYAFIYIVGISQTRCI